MQHDEKKRCFTRFQHYFGNTIAVAHMKACPGFPQCKPGVLRRLAQGNSLDKSSAAVIPGLRTEPHTFFKVQISCVMTFHPHENNNKSTFFSNDVLIIHLIYMSCDKDCTCLNDVQHLFYPSVILFIPGGGGGGGRVSTPNNIVQVRGRGNDILFGPDIQSKPCYEGSGACYTGKIFDKKLFCAFQRMFSWFYTHFFLLANALFC